MFAVTSSVQNLLPQVASFCSQFPVPTGRIGLHRGIEVRQICSLYQNVVNQIPKEKWQEIIEETKACVPRKVIRQKHIVLPLDNFSSMIIHPASSQIYIQRRGFRPLSSKGVGRTSATEETAKGSLLSNLFSKTAQPIENREYKETLNSLKSEQQKLAFKDGYIIGINLGKSHTGKEKQSFLQKLGNLIMICISLSILWTLIGFIGKMISGKGPIGINFMNNSALEVKPEEITVTFDDVRGLDEAKKEVEEIVDYLRDPDKYTRLGGRLPKGVLLVGPPGTGKTLLARAIAGEAGVPFFHASGSEFDEVLVGQGARRVRDLFEKAKVRAPCIIFIDEIDSVGSKRVSDGLHPYANQTINQLLSEMDGFKRNEGVIVLGATNRIEDLDKALLRPGRFDSRVHVNIPDFSGRRDIFELYLNRITHGKLVLDVLSKGTIGFTGADIENMVNQAALKAATENCDKVLMRHLEEAKDRILMGPARVKGRIPDEETNKNTAYHEAGHALVAYYTKDAQPIHKVTIIQRGPSLGHTSFLPEQDSYQVTRSQLMAQLDTLMGGRVAEELILGREKVTTGASDDLRKATELALRLVKQYGMGPALRDYTVELEKNKIVSNNEIGPQTMEILDREVNLLLDESYNRAKEILTKHKKEHQILAEALFEYETLTSEEVKSLLEGRKINRSVETKLPTVLPPLPREMRPAIVKEKLVKNN